MLDPPRAEIRTLVRLPSPAPRPQSLSHDGTSLWMGSWETERVYGVDPAHGSVFEEMTAPGKPVGSTMLGDELRFVLSENGDGDNRFIRRYVPGHGFKTHDVIACPDDTGSFLAYDGSHLWLTQSANKCVLRLEAEGTPLRSIHVGENIMGAVWCGDALYLVLWLGKARGGSHLGFIVPGDDDGTVTTVARIPFVATGLAFDGTRFWTNDHHDAALVAFEADAR